MTFILQPLYKLTATVVGEHPKTIERVLGEEFGVYLKSSSYSQDVKPLLKEVRSVCLWVCGSDDGGMHSVGCAHAQCSNINSSPLKVTWHNTPAAPFA